jgi:hypothetical protein
MVEVGGPMSGARLVATVGLLAILTSGVVRASGESPASATIYDCGTLAVYNLLRLEGREVTLTTIERHLGRPARRGYSLKELRRSASACGLELEGVLLPKSGKAPSRAALVYLDRQPDGHFLLIRPVGLTGKLVQVFDSNEAPYVLDAALLHASPEWTGLALVPRERTYLGNAIGFLAIIVGGAILVVARSGKSRLAESAGQGRAE